MLTTLELQRRYAMYCDNMIKKFENEEIGEDTDVMDFEDFEAIYATQMGY